MNCLEESCHTRRQREGNETNSLQAQSKMFKSTIKIALVIISLTYYEQITVTGLAIDQQSRKNFSLNPLNSVHHQEFDLRPPADARRPIWNLAHMVNSIKELDYRLSKGANAVEADVTFGRNGDPLYTYHGPPCDCWRHCHQAEDFNDYLRYVHELSEETGEDATGKNLTLLFLDLKLDHLDQWAKVKAGVELAKSVRANLFPGKPLEVSSSTTKRGNLRKPLRLILSINHVTDIELVLNFVHHLEENGSGDLLQRIGFDVGMNDELNLIEYTWKKYGRQLNLWQGDGYTNCFSPFYNLERLTKAILKRDQADGYPKKVYQWTIDLHDRIREALRMGVDAIMTNHPERLLNILLEPEMAQQFRLATQDDDPFNKVIVKRDLKLRQERSAPSTGSGFFGSFFDVISSWFAYMKEIPFLSLPTTTRFLSGSRAKHRQRSPQDIAKSSDQARHSIASDSTPNETTISASTQQASSTSLSPSISDSVDEAIVGTTENNNNKEPLPYEGPKWYTSLASNFLVSMLKIMLPAP